MSAEGGKRRARGRRGKEPGAPVTVLTVAYDGAPFSGFARQPGLETVQGRLEEALQTALRREVSTVGAGRTDAGVHAIGQVVSYEEAGGDVAHDALARSLNALAGPDMVVRHVRRAAPGFSARHSALSREYRYRIVPGPVPPVFVSRYAWWAKSELDTDAMRRAGMPLLGQHDFKSFCVAESAEGKPTVRRIDSLVVGPDVHLGEPCVTVRIVASGFLHSMVRVIVGTLVEVGRGHKPGEWVEHVLHACDRGAAGPTAPPHGLTLWRVEYPDDVWT